MSRIRNPAGEIYSHAKVKVVCDAQSEEIVPISWVLKQGFLDKASLHNMTCSPLR
jgi:hypothetical protein